MKFLANLIVVPFFILATLIVGFQFALTVFFESIEKAWHNHETHAAS